MIDIIFLLAATSMKSFFSIASAVGLEYKGFDSSRSYVIFLLSIGLLNVFLLLYFLLIRRIPVTWPSLFVLSIPAISAATLFMESFYLGNPTSDVLNFFGQHLIWAVPAICAGVLVVRLQRIPELLRWLEVLMWIFAVGTIRATFIPFLQGNPPTSFGGGTRQAISYIAALSFGIALHLILDGHMYHRFKFTRTRIYRGLLLILIPFQILSVFLSGGRGGAVLLVLYVLYFFYRAIFKRDSKRKKLRFLGFALIGITCLVLAIPQLKKDPVFDARLARAFQFLSSDGSINWEGTSGRDTVYANMVALIREEPLTGYGVFSHQANIRRPHNLFLEVLIGGGVIYSAIFVGFAIVFLGKMSRLLKYNNQATYLLILSLYPLTMLMFSGSYMITPEFWFIIAVVMTGTSNSQSQHKKTADFNLTE